MKKSIVFLVVFTLLIGMFTVPASAEDYSIKVQAPSFVAHDGPAGTFDNWTNQLYIYSGHWASYDVNFEQTGCYKIQVRLGSYSAVTEHKITPYYDGVSLGQCKYTPTKIAPDGDAGETYDIGYVNVGKTGTHQIKLAFDQAQVRFVWFMLTRVSDINFSKAAKDYSAGTPVNPLGDERVDISANATGKEWLEYSIDFPMSGIYELSVNYGAGADVGGSGYLHTYLDGSLQKKISEYLPDTGNAYGTFNDAKLSTLVVKTPGTHTLKLQAYVAGAVLKKLTFTRTGDADPVYLDGTWNAQDSKFDYSISNSTSGDISAVAYCAVYSEDEAGILTLKDYDKLDVTLTKETVTPVSTKAFSTFEDGDIVKVFVWEGYEPLAKAQSVVTAQ